MTEALESEEEELIMSQRMRTWTPGMGALLSALVLSACAIPSVHGIAADVPRVFDESLLGTWYVGESKVTKYRVNKGENGFYQVLVQGLGDDDEPLELRLTVAMIELDGRRLIDVTLHKREVKNLLDRYGMLAMPTHVVFAIETDGARLRLKGLEEDWPKGLSGYVESSGGDIAVLTADPCELRTLFRAALKDPRAWDKEVELIRYR